MEGEIKYLSHVSQLTPTKFFNSLRKSLDGEGFKDLYVEIQYSTTMQPDGSAIFSALLIGRVPTQENMKKGVDESSKTW